MNADPPGTYSPILIDGDGLAQYPVTPNMGFSPPAKWGEEFSAQRDPAMLSPYIPPEWASLDVARVPGLVAPPPVFADSELQDLFALKAVRMQFWGRIMQEEPSARLAERFQETLRRAGADLEAVVRASDRKTGAEVVLEFAKLVEDDAACIVLNQKALFNRQRPYQAAPGLNPMFCPPHPAYPSGHSTQGHAVAFAMGYIFAGSHFDSVCTQFADFASAAAQRREIAGVHYRSDTVAGIVLARRLVDCYEQAGKNGKSDFKGKFLIPLRSIKPKAAAKPGP